jgi:hypothetical protein
MQQGRVQLDADWNEQQQIYQHLRAIQTRDIIGTSGGPTQDAGFAVTVAADNKSLTNSRRPAPLASKPPRRR